MRFNITAKWQIVQGKRVIFLSLYSAVKIWVFIVSFENFKDNLNRALHNRKTRKLKLFKIHITSLNKKIFKNIFSFEFISHKYFICCITATCNTYLSIRRFIDLFFSLNIVRNEISVVYMYIFLYFSQLWYSLVLQRWVWQQELTDYGHTSVIRANGLWG